MGVTWRANKMTTQGSRQPKGVVGVKELREEASAIIAEVEQGNWFLVSKRGNLVGVLLPSAMAEQLLLEHAGDIVTLQLQKAKERA